MLLDSDLSCIYLPSDEITGMWCFSQPHVFLSPPLPVSVFILPSAFLFCLSHFFFPFVLTFLFLSLTFYLFLFIFFLHLPFPLLFLFLFLSPPVLFLSPVALSSLILCFVSILLSFPSYLWHFRFFPLSPSFSPPSSSPFLSSFFLPVFFHLPLIMVSNLCPLSSLSFPLSPSYLPFPSLWRSPFFFFSFPFPVLLCSGVWLDSNLILRPGWPRTHGWCSCLCIVLKLQMCVTIAR